MIESRLQELGISLPSPASPVENYVPFVKVGTLVFISGQLPSLNGELRYRGKLGQDFIIEKGQEAARLCALNLLAHLKKACEGDLNRVRQCVRLGGFINSMESFKDQPQVLNGASDLMIAVFGEKGKHARSAVGVNTLPFGSAVEVEAIFDLNP